MTDPISTYSVESEEDDELYVVRRCPHCGRFLRSGQVLINGLGDVALRGWTCTKHGEVKPEWGWF